MNKTYNVQNILNEMQKYENNEITIKTKNKKFYIKLFKNFSPHLLGVQYIDSEGKYKGLRLSNFIKKNNLSDQDILDMIEKNHGTKQKLNVENRINTFLDFMRNLEKGILVEKTLESGMTVNYLIIQNKKEMFMHLGIMSCNNGALLDSYEELSKKEKDFFRSYFIEINNRYFNKSKIFEDIENIKIYDEILEEYLPFSFDEYKNQLLLEKYKANKNLNYQEAIKEYESMSKLDKDSLDIEYNDEYEMEM